jgi:serine/threonine protein kinase
MHLTADDTEAVAHSAWEQHQSRRAQPLGTGQFGRVYRVSYAGTVFAVKVLSLGVGDSGVNTFDVERRVAEQLPAHPHLVRSLATLAVTSVRTGFVVMEYAHPATLGDLADDAPAYDTLAIMLAISSAVGVMHRAGIAHRDIKADNISYDPASQTTRLFDYGLAEICERSDRAHAHRRCGSPLFMPPEMLDENFRGTRSPFAHDIWALGHLLYFLQTRKDMFSACRNLPQLRKAVRYHSFGAESVKIDARFRVLFLHMLSRHPPSRPSIEGVCGAFSRIAMDKENQACSV